MAAALLGCVIGYCRTLALTSFPFLVPWQLILSSWEGGYNLQCQNLDSAGEGDIRVSPGTISIEKEQRLPRMVGSWGCIERL